MSSLIASDKPMVKSKGRQLEHFPSLFPVRFSKLEKKMLNVFSLTTYRHMKPS